MLFVLAMRPGPADGAPQVLWSATALDPSLPGASGPMPFYKSWNAPCSTGGTAMPASADGLYDITATIFNPFPTPYTLTGTYTWTGYFGLIVNGSVRYTDTEGASPTPCSFHYGRSFTVTLPTGYNSLTIRTQMTVVGPISNQNPPYLYYGGYVDVVLLDLPVQTAHHSWARIKQLYR